DPGDGMLGRVGEGDDRGGIAGQCAAIGDDARSEGEPERPKDVVELGPGVASRWHERQEPAPGGGELPEQVHFLGEEGQAGGGDHDRTAVEAGPGSGGSEGERRRFEAHPPEGAGERLETLRVLVVDVAFAVADGEADGGRRPGEPVDGAGEGNLTDVVDELAPPADVDEDLPVALDPLVAGPGRLLVRVDDLEVDRDTGRLVLADDRPQLDG